MMLVLVMMKMVVSMPLWMMVMRLTGDIRIIMINCNSSNSFVTTTSLIISSINITIRQNVSGKAEKHPTQLNKTKEKKKNRHEGKAAQQEKH